MAVEWPATDDVRVDVYADDGDPRLAAAVELVSPRNKDRHRAREAFAGKCAEYLRRGCGLVVVDAVTTRRADLRADLLATLGAEPVAGQAGAVRGLLSGDRPRPRRPSPGLAGAPGGGPASADRAALARGGPGGAA